MEPPISLHIHRLQNSRSRFPTFRKTDLASTSSNNPNEGGREGEGKGNSLADLSPPQPEHLHTRNHSESAATASSPSRPPLSLHPRSLTSLGTHALENPIPTQKARNVPASHSRGTGPPPAMITQKISLQHIDTKSSTKVWVNNQSTLTPPISAGETNISPAHLPSQSQSQPPTPLIPPIRAFRSSRRSAEMGETSTRRVSMDQDDTLRALDGFNSQRPPHREEEQNSDDSDLFLKLAREEPTGTSRSGIRRSQQSQMNRQSLPPSSTLFQPSISRRRGSDHEGSPADQNDHIGQALTYRSSVKDRTPTALDINRNRYYGANSRSTPTTPRALGSREISPESQNSYGERKPSIPDSVLPSRTSSYRQSNLSYSIPRTYNSSPLVSRTTDIHDGPEMPRPAEGTESTVSTTAPSTVWDELEDLKSRIHRLELTGKLPATSGAAISRASDERPPTATTTVTTISSSPKRGRGNSLSPTDSAGVEASPGDAHPLLSSALTKSKSLLSPEVYKALEATAADALAIASMMGSSGQPGPISSSQSTIGGASTFISDRQVRRKADSMCRSLTELCLALSEGKSEQNQPIGKQTRPLGRGSEAVSELDNVQRQPVSTELARVKSSPRALSRLEARRSSLLATTALPSPRYAPSETTTPTQTSMAGRRTSLLLRSRRGGTEEPEEEEENRFRATSRATTEIGRLRNSPREYVSHEPLPDNRFPPIQSSLPVRRHYVSTSLTNTGGAQALPTTSNLASRRYVDRPTPEPASAMTGRLTEDHAQRKSSIGHGFPLGRASSLTGRTRQPTNLPSAGQTGYQ